MSLTKKFGITLIWLGIMLTAIGVIGGFSAMFMDKDEIAKVFLMGAPFGFLSLFTGMVMTLLKPN